MTIETPSGKGAGDENFPVASWLLPARTRPHVLAFYAFARAIDDIADDPHLPAAEKLLRLDRMAAGLAPDNCDPAAGTAHCLRSSLAETGVTARHALDLVDAFRQDAVKRRYADWDELMDYCGRSAAPVGRFLLDLHAEPADLQPVADALCNALQVVNHLQDCGADFRSLDRVYLPEPWIVEGGGAVGDLGADAASRGVRHAIDRCLDGVDALLVRSAPLMRAMRSTRLALETAVVQRIAERLAHRLRSHDPLATRVALGKVATLDAAASGIARAILARRSAWRRT